MVYVRPSPRTPGAPLPAAPPAAPAPFSATGIWLPPDPGSPDKTLKVQALNLLLETHSEQVIPLLREMALDRESPDEARQAVFVLGQSRRPEARRTMVEVAREGAEPARIAAVRELGRFDGPMISSELMHVYTMANTPPRLKWQVVSSLGERADNASLVRIVRSESEVSVRDYAIVTLGRTGARDQLRQLYVQTPVSRPAVLKALFRMKDDDELIRIASTERDPALRTRARDQLRLLATPKAVKYLEEHP
jgi:HEAT repeat protein